MNIPPVAADLFRAVAPVLGGALGGPLGGTVAALAVRALNQWVVPSGPQGPTPEDVVRAVERNADDPRFALDLKRAELVVKDYELKMKKIDARFDLLKLHQQDRDSARAFVRDTGAAPFSQKLGMALLVQDALTTLAVLGGSFVLMTGLYSIPDPATFAALIGFIGVVLGRISARAETFVNFMFGSSAGSKEKTNTLGAAVENLGHALAERPAPAAPPPPMVVQAPAPALPPPPAPEPSWRQGPHGGQRWRLTPAGVVVEGETAPMRTVGQPATIRRVWRDYGPLVAASGARNGVPLEIIAATIATESRGIPAAVLVEGDGRQSVGLMQTLVGTASEVMGRQVMAAELADPALSIEAGTRYIARQRGLTGFDPPLVAAAYNAGGLHPPREGDVNPWRLRSTGDHIDRFAQYYGDACFVAAEDGWGHTDNGKENTHG